MNVERSFKVGDEVGGHVVSGHVSTTATLEHLHHEGNDRVLTLGRATLAELYLPQRLCRTGWGESTVSSVNRETSCFSASLIPETIERTTLGYLSVGGLVNVEIDSQTQAVVDTVERVLAERQDQPSNGS